MGWMRRMLGWLLVIIGGFVVASLVLTAVGEALHPRSSPTPLIAYGLGGLVFGVCPLFLGWVLVRSKEPSMASTAPDITSVVPEQLPPVAPVPAVTPSELVVDAFLLQSDLTHLFYRIFWKNWFIRFFYAGFLVTLLSLISQWHSLKWEGWQHLLYPAVVVGLITLPWLNARVAFMKYARAAPTRFTFTVAGFRSANTGLVIDSSWDSVRACWETTTAFVFFVRPPSRILYRPETGEATIVPKRCLRHPEDEGRLRTLLGHALGRRATLLPPGKPTQP